MAKVLRQNVGEVNVEYTPFFTGHEVGSLSISATVSIRLVEWREYHEMVAEKGVQSRFSLHDAVSSLKERTDRTPIKISLGGLFDRNRRHVQTWDVGCCP